MSRLEQLKAELAREIERQSPATFTNEEKANINNDLSAIKDALNGVEREISGDGYPCYVSNALKALEERIAKLEAKAGYKFDPYDAAMHVPGAYGINLSYRIADEQPARTHSDTGTAERDTGTAERSEVKPVNEKSPTHYQDLWAKFCRDNPTRNLFSHRVATNDPENNARMNLQVNGYFNQDAGDED